MKKCEPHVISSEHRNVCDWWDLRDEVALLRARIATLEAALTKIDLIRNSIIGNQSVNWSAHIYPLVEALHDAGFDGSGYEEARAQAIDAALTGRS